MDVATHVSGVLEHEGGALSTVVMSFDVWAAELPRIEVYGTEGTVSVPDPNGFDGPVRLYREPEWVDVVASAGYRETGRGCGVVDMARAVTAGRGHRANGEVAYHVLDVMESLLAAAAERTSVDVRSRCSRPDGVPLGEFEVDADRCSGWGRVDTDQVGQVVDQ
ncbi:hypothetical protein GCM10029964_041350 [Kibdelosporangium lantanae]